MKIKIEKKYITLPISHKTTLKRLRFKDSDGKLVYDLECMLDSYAPDFTAYVNVERFKGMELELTVSPEMSFDIGTSDEYISDEVYSDELRPRIHFTVKNGWNNDPNGLIKMNGEYHMFYQYNPCSAQWGNMHWGHAVSKDLLHWKELDCALFPDEFGTMYSGSAIEDKNGIVPTGSGSSPKMLLYYTAAGSTGEMSRGEKYTQRLAYSEDGRSFIKYEGEPMIPHIEGGNRDPKVVWVEELGCYILALYIDKNLFMLFKSADLIKWEHFQDLTLPSDRECPDIFPLYSEGEKLWVICGASDYYVVGKFTDGKFVTVSKEKRLSQNPMNYAAQSFSGIEDGRIVRVYWQRTRFPSTSFTQQMSIPTEMSLRREINGYHLFALPVKEIEELRKESIVHKNISLTEPLTENISPAPLDITLEAEYHPENTVDLNIFGANIKIDTKNNCVNLLRSKAPLSFKKDKIKLRIIVDRCTVELFADDGRYLLTEQCLWDRNLPAVKLSSSRELNVDSFDIHILNGIH